MSHDASAAQASSHRRRRTAISLVLIAGVLAVIYLCILFVDTPLAQYKPEVLKRPIVEVLETIGYLMGGWKLAPAILALTLIAAGARWRRLLLTVVVAYLIRTTVVEWLKFLTGRPRPRAMDGVTAFYGPGAEYHSFPSGHAAFAFMFAVIAGAYFPRWRWLWYVWAAYICAMRMVADAHFLSDVLLGGLIGVLTGSLALYWWPPGRATPGDEA